MKQIVLLCVFVQLISCQGRRGYTGAPGRQGPKGEPGEPGGPTVIVNQSTGEGNQEGSVGPTGPRGATGRDGEDGQPGQDGRNGRDGVDGSNGEDGQNGSDGRDGIDGENAMGIEAGWKCSFRRYHCITTYEALFHQGGSVTVNLSTKQVNGRMKSISSVTYHQNHPDLDVTPVVNDFYYAERLLNKQEVIFTDDRTGYQFVWPCTETDYTTNEDEEETEAAVTQQLDDMLDDDV